MNYFRSGHEVAIDINHLRVIRGKRPALHDFSVRVARGTITGLLGPSGCGKTTLIRCIVGTQLIDVGHRAGARFACRDPRRCGTGSATCRRTRRSTTTCGSSTTCDISQRYTALTADAADSAIDRVGLTDHSTAYCGNFSGGQRTRVSLACALVCQPELLVLDEPTVGLDPVLRADLWEQFTELARGGTTLLVSSHVMDEADHCGDLLLMRDGHLVAQTTRPNYERTPDARHWRTRFCPSSSAAQRG